LILIIRLRSSILFRFFHSFLSDPVSFLFEISSFLSFCFKMKKCIAPLAVLLTVAAATPTANRLVARAEPSAFPGDGAACTNEPKYINFDVSKPADKAKVNKLHEAFCNGIGPMFERAAHFVEAANRVIYERWFVEDDKADPPEDEQVLSVYERLWDRENHHAQPLVANFIFDNMDFLGQCGVDGKDVAGYTGLDENGDDLEKTHFCPVAFEFPTHPDGNACNELSPYPDVNMESLSRIMVHELTHYKTVGEESEVGFGIIDAKSNDGLAAYYPSRCHALKTEKPDLVNINADNYAWLAAVSLPLSSMADYMTDDRDFRTLSMPSSARRLLTTHRSMLKVIRVTLTLATASVA
jgi:hypothetical protein